MTVIALRTRDEPDASASTRLGLVPQRAVVRVRQEESELHYDELRSTPLTTLRPTPGALYLVSAMATPLAGDRAELELTVGAGTALTVRSVGAAVARRGAGARSVALVTAEVGPGAVLRWEPAPAVAAAGCAHRSVATLRLATGGVAVWWDTVVLGRTGETPGDWSSLLRVDANGAPVLRSELSFGPEAPGFDGPAVAGGGRAVGSVLVAADGLPPLHGGGTSVVDRRGRAVATELARGGVLISAAAGGYCELLSLVDDLAERLPPDVGRHLRSLDSADVENRVRERVGETAGHA